MTLSLDILETAIYSRDEWNVDAGDEADGDHNNGNSLSSFVGMRICS